MLRDLEQPGQHLAEHRRQAGAQHPPPGGDREHRERGRDEPGQHELGPLRRLDRVFGASRRRSRRTPRAAGCAGRSATTWATPTLAAATAAGIFLRCRYLMFSAAPPTAAGVTSVTKDPATWASRVRKKGSRSATNPDSYHRRADVGGRRQGQRRDPPAPVRRAQHARRDWPGRARRPAGRPAATLATSVTRVRSRMRSSWTGATSPPGTAASSRLRRAGSTSRRRRSAARVERASATGCSSGTTATSLVRARLLEGQVGGPVRPDDRAASSAMSWATSRRICRSLAATSPSPGSSSMACAVVGEQDAVRGQPAVRDLAGVQPVHRVPYLPEFGVGAAGIPLGQRRPVVVVVGEHGGFGTDPDQGAQPRCGRARILRRVGQQRPVLDRCVPRTAGRCATPARAAGPTGTAGRPRRPPAGPGRTRRRPAGRRPRSSPRSGGTRGRPRCPWPGGPARIAVTGRPVAASAAAISVRWAAGTWSPPRT